MTPLSPAVSPSPAQRPRGAARGHAAVSSLPPGASPEGSRDTARLLRRNSLFDVYSIGQQVDALLALELNELGLKLNRDLIRELRNAFDHWLIASRNELLTQMQRVPEHARNRWLHERLEFSGLSWQWFAEIGAVDPNGEDADPPQLSEQRTRDDRRADQQGIRLLVDFLLQHSRVLLTRLGRLKSGNQDFRRNIAAAGNVAEREQVTLRYATQLGATRRELRRDEAALARWFDEEAVNDRFVRQQGQCELELTFAMGRLGIVLDRLFQLVRSRDSSTDQLKQLASRLSLEDRLVAVWHYDGDHRVCVAALDCLRQWLAAIPSDAAAQILSDHVIVDLNRAAFKNHVEVWVQCRALDVLVLVDPENADELLTRRLSRIQSGDELFVRRHVLRIFEKRFLSGESPLWRLPPASDEPSEFVRQQYAAAAFASQHPANHQQWQSLAKQDPVPQVRAAALLAIINGPCPPSRRFDALECVVHALQNDSDPFVVRAALHVAVTFLNKALRSETERETHAISDYFEQRIIPVIADLTASSSTIALRRYAAASRQQIWAMMDEPANDLLRQIAEPIRNIPAGKTRRFPNAWFDDFSDQRLGRVLSVLTLDDFGLDVCRTRWGVYITRGPVLGFRFWRLWYEATHSATDKRQAIRHTVGRINAAPLRVPSQIAGELSETKVPGEPLTIAADGTWRPFLPLPDDMVAVLNQSWLRVRPIRFVTVQGVTTVTAPTSLFKRCLAAARLTFGFTTFAKQRNWNDGSTTADTYISSLRKLGFVIRFDRHDDQLAEPADDSVERFFNANTSDFKSVEPDSPTIGQATFPAIMVFSQTADDWWQRFRDYFAAAFENSLEHLLWFAGAVTVLVLLKHFWSNVRLRNARQQIPVSIGGWGTRGKSGTERLKAALINAMGYGLVSKTTGCEAMFIQAEPFSDPLEIPLFRPFDKATIWEQSNLIRSVSGMQPSVFLWECMALTPSYVDVLQRQWTRDDLATITNTYPDHEDLQGPAGHNVATTIAGFVPEKSHLISTEEQMRPYLQESCRRVETSFRGVGWLESGLVTEDVLARFPYKEHPDNVALVAAVAAELDVSYDVAIKSMGDNLVPDLGVLKTHAPACVRTRTISFTNGMSANERFGCMGNWHRLGLDEHDPWKGPTTWISGVVNNRADRVPRSKVFAKIMVDDLNVDRFFLIGDNLKGMQGFVDEAWEERAASITLRDSSRGNRWDKHLAIEKLREAAKQSRQVIDLAQMRLPLSTMITAAADWSGIEVPDSLRQLETVLHEPHRLAEALLAAKIAPEMILSISEHHSKWLQSIDEFEIMQSRIRRQQTDVIESLEADFRMLLKDWFFRKIIVVPDYDATGEEVVSVVANATPPGFNHRVVGLQNIKGTGLDFVYRFQAWDDCYEACQRVTRPQMSEMIRGLEALVAMPAIGQLCEEAVCNVIDHVRQSKAILRSDIQVLVRKLEQRLERRDGWLPRGKTAEKRRSAAESTAGVTAGTTAMVDKSNATSQPIRAWWHRWFLRYSEELLDLLDSLKRRERADQVYRDLASGRIGRQRAVAVLREINKRQKGGWLGKG